MGFHLVPLKPLGIWRCLCLALLVFPLAVLQARITYPPGLIDLVPLLSAPVLVRGVVGEVVVSKKRTLPYQGTATIKVDRWYRGGSAQETTVRFSAEPVSIAGHDCIYFRPGERWLIFAFERGGSLDLADDCYGAVAISSRLAARSSDSDIRSQLEADFVAGLDDADSAGRLASIQRLGGLRSPASRDALHRVIAAGDATERDWATFAALRTQDVSVLPRVAEMFSRGRDAVFLNSLAWELSQLADPAAAPGLIALANESPHAPARKAAVSALARCAGGSDVLPTIASRLKDSAPSVRFTALEAVASLTHEPECTIPPSKRHSNDMIEPQIRQCIDWWNRSGRK